MSGGGEFFGHPRGLSTLFFTEMWERASYYGMRALLILFMTAGVANGGLGYDTATASMVYGLFTAMAYMTALPGGWIADRILGQQRAVLVGGVLIAAGNFLLVVPSVPAFFGGLAVIVAGTSLLKPNVSAIVGQLYTQGDTRRDAGFSIFYMGINLGAFLAPLITGWLAQTFGWRFGFLFAAVGMSFGVVQYGVGRASLGDAGREPATTGDVSAVRQLRIGLLVIFGVIGGVSVLALQGVVSAKGIADASGILLLALIGGFFMWMFGAASWTPVEKRRLYVVAVLFIASTVFWSVFEQAGSSLNLFAQRSTDNNVAGFPIPAPWYQSVNGLFIIVFAPVFAALWLRLGSKEPSSPAKFSWGLGLVGLGFVVMAVAATLSANGVLVSPLWLVVTYLLHTAGELCLSPVGLSAMTKLAPGRVAGLMMGVWFLSISAGNYLGGRMAAFYEALPLPMLFGIVGLVAIVAGLLLAVFVKPIVRLMEGVR